MVEAAAQDPERHALRGDGARVGFGVDAAGETRDGRRRGSELGGERPRQRPAAAAGRAGAD